MKSKRSMVINEISQRRPANRPVYFLRMEDYSGLHYTELIPTVAVFRMLTCNFLPQSHVEKNEAQ
ncbi:hypothetical protein ALT785_240026 [Alteromonas infernus]